MTVQFTPIPKIVTTFIEVSSEPSPSFLMITSSTTSPPCNAPRSNITIQLTLLITRSYMLRL